MISDFVDLAEAVSQPGVVEVPTSLLDGVGRLEDDDHERFQNEVLQHKDDTHGSQPVSLVVIGGTGQSHQPLDGDGPANPKNAESCAIVPMEIAEYLFLAGVDPLLILLHLFLVGLLDNFLLGVVLDKQFLVDFMHEDLAPDEGEGNGDNEGDDGRPDENGGSSVELPSDDGGNKHALNGPLDQHNGQPRQFGIELLMRQIEDGVERPGSPDVVGVFILVEDFSGGRLREEVEQPVDENDDEDEPHNVALSQDGLELNREWGTLPLLGEA